jgi:hypothetical protein
VEIFAKLTWKPGLKEKRPAGPEILEESIKFHRKMRKICFVVKGHTISPSFSNSLPLFYPSPFLLLPPLDYSLTLAILFPFSTLSPSFFHFLYYSFTVAFPIFYSFPFLLPLPLDYNLHLAILFPFSIPSPSFFDFL